MVSCVSEVCSNDGQRSWLRENKTCLWNTDAPAPTKSNYDKNLKSYILTPPHPKGHVMSVKCELPLDEVTVQVWLLYDHLNFKYCTLFISGTELRMDRRFTGPHGLWTCTWVPFATIVEVPPPPKIKKKTNKHGRGKLRTWFKPSFFFKFQFYSRVVG